jgi:hypothetical protein
MPVPVPGRVLVLLCWEWCSFSYRLSVFSAALGLALAA